MLVTYMSALPSLSQFGQREVGSCLDFILGAVATFWAMSLVGIYPGRASMMMMMMMINFVQRVRLDDEDADDKIG